MLNKTVKEPICVIWKEGVKEIQEFYNSQEHYDQGSEEEGNCAEKDKELVGIPE
jgi:hypothetical protein